MNAFSNAQVTEMDNYFAQTTEGRIEVLLDERASYLRRMHIIEETELGPNGEWFFLDECIEDIDQELKALGYKRSSFITLSDDGSVIPF